jgi:hypothetical protein
VEVRLIEPRDNEALVELSRLTPMEGAISVYIERAPRFENFYDLHGVHGITISDEEFAAGQTDTWNTLVAEENGRVIGVMGSSSRILLFDGKPIRVGYLMDARVHPDHRRKGVVRTIGFGFVQRYGHFKIDCVLGFILRGNERAVQGLTEGGGDIFKGARGGYFHLYQISMYRPYFVGRLKMERATPADQREIVELLAEFYRGYNFAPRFTEEFFARQMRVSLGYSYDQIRVVRENGRIVALLGLWDEAPVKQTVVLKNTAVVRAGIAIARFLHLFIKSPPPPVEGQPLRSLYIKHIACRPGYERTLHRMLKAATNEVRRAGTHHFIWGAFYHTDPLRRLFDGLTKTEVLSDMFWGPWNTGWNADPQQVIQQPAYADFSLV